MVKKPADGRRLQSAHRPPPEGGVFGSDVVAVSGVNDWGGQKWGCVRGVVAWYNVSRHAATSTTNLYFGAPGFVQMRIAIGQRPKANGCYTLN
jgi:hypothetical protein